MATKDDLIKENEILTRENSDFKNKDAYIREKISQFLGSVEIRNRFGSREELEVKVLSWSNIYFELGKLMQKSGTFFDLTNLINSQKKNENLIDDLFRLVTNLIEKNKKNE